MKRKRTSEFGPEPSVVTEDVERRLDRRGPVPGLEVVLPDDERANVLEAGRRDLFLSHDEPDRFALGARLEITITRRGTDVRARAEVVRKEIAPRRGIALLIVHMSPTASERFLKMLEV